MPPRKEVQHKFRHSKFDIEEEKDLADWVEYNEQSQYFYDSSPSDDESIIELPAPKLLERLNLCQAIELAEQTFCLKNNTKSNKIKLQQRILNHEKQQFVNLQACPIDEFKVRLCPNVVVQDVMQKCEHKSSIHTQYSSFTDLDLAGDSSYVDSQLVDLFQMRLKLHKNEDFSPSKMVPLGGSMIVKCHDNKKAIGVRWEVTLNDFQKITWNAELLPINRCSWKECCQIQVDMLAYLSVHIQSTKGPLSLTNPSCLQKCKIFDEISSKILGLSDWLVSRLKIVGPIDSANMYKGWLRKGFKKGILPCGECFDSFDQIDFLIRPTRDQKAQKSTIDIYAGSFKDTDVMSPCLICLEDFPASSHKFTFRPCGHNVCEDCMR